MKNLTILLLAVLVFSCGNKKEGKLEYNDQKDESAEIIDSTFLEVIDDCIFDQSTQTDKFLEDIQALKGYVWDYESRTATLILENRDTLLIGRGGCYDFGVSAEFRIRNDRTDYRNWKNVFDKVLWIAKVLENEFAYNELREAIFSKEFVIENYDSSDFVSFSNEYLQMNHYEIVRIFDGASKKIILSYYIN